MNIVVRSRRGGKTEELLRWMQEAPEGAHRVLVSPTLEESHRVQRLSRERGLSLESWQFVALGEVSRQTWSGVLMGRGGYIELGLDNLDLMLSQLIYWPVAAITLTEEPSDG